MGETLETPTDPQAFIGRLQTALALEGDRTWGKRLDEMIGEEYELDCPQCEVSLFVVFGEHGHFATHEDYATTADVARTPLLPAHPDQMDRLGRRLHAMSTDAGQDIVAEVITYVFGKATCSECGMVFSVADQVNAD